MINKILHTFGTRTVSAVLNLLIVILVSQILGPEGKGEQALVIATIAYILVFANLVGGGTLIYLVPRYHYAQLAIPAYVWTLIVSTLSIGVLFVFDLVPQEFIIHLTILSVINSFTNINTSILIGKEKIKTSNLVAFITPLVTLSAIFIGFFILKGDSILVYIIALYIAFGLSFLISIYFIRKHLPPFQIYGLKTYGKIVRDMVRYGLLNQLAHIFQLSSFRISFYWLDKALSESGDGIANVGIYSNGISIIESLWLISKSISLVQYARIANSNDALYNQKLTVQLTKASLVISTFILIPLILLPSVFFEFIFGAGFGEVSPVIRLLAPGVLVYNFSLLYGHYFSGQGKYFVNTIASFAGLLVAIGCFYYLIPAYGIYGASIGTTISYITTSVVVMLFYVRENQLPASDFVIRPKEIRQFIRENIFTRKRL